ncbi:MAG: cyclic nucleotide-binding domain-containing protein [Chloroflexi bacterium]|nr:cyclic nucleotide-binding domain-containing protein [Chloroflexota bacterium]
MAAKQILKECSVFSVLSDAELEKIASSALEREYEAGTTIFQGGDRAEELLVVKEGKIALQMMLPAGQEQRGRKVTVDVVNKNEVVGWSAIVEPYVYNFTAVCLQKVQVLSISGTRLRLLLQDNPKIGYDILRGLIKVVASRLDETRQLLISERMLVPKAD